MGFFSWWLGRTARRGPRSARRPRRLSPPLRLEQLESRDLLSATLVADINPIATASSYPHGLTGVNGTLFFTASDGNSVGLWKSDGTSTGTTLVKDIGADNLTNVNGTLFFSHARGELWKSDGTSTGTTLVKDINSSTTAVAPIGFINVNGTLFFQADDGVHGRELWKSDSTEAGTVLVKDINPGSGGSFPYGVNVNGTFFFSAFDGNSRELWKSDGTEAGTVLVKNINPGGSSYLTQFTDVNGTLFFDANDGVHGEELWKSDGTTDGTVLVKDINPGTSIGDPRPLDLTNVNGTLFFTADDGVHGRELWKSDGTAAGTVLVKDATPGSVGSFFSSSFSSGNLTNVNGTLFFTANDGTNVNALWKSDGTANGTVVVKDISPDFFYKTYLTNVNGTLFFTADAGHAIDLWKSDGTAADTVRVQTLPLGVFVFETLPSHFTAVDGSLFFSAFTPQTGVELWRASQFLQSDSAQTAEGTPVAIKVLANDFVAAGSQPVLSVAPPGHGSAILNPDGSITYTPSAGFNGVDTFTYTVVNRFGDTDTATVTVTVFRPVQIDIGQDAINVASNGDIAITVFSSATFDAATIDVNSVIFAGARAVQSSLEDVNNDGLLDLVLHFRVQDTNLVHVYQQLLLSDASADGTLDSTRQTTSLLLSGTTTSGVLWEGLDAASLFLTGKKLNDLLTTLGLE